MKGKYFCTALGQVSGWEGRYIPLTRAALISEGECFIHGVFLRLKPLKDLRGIGVFRVAVRGFTKASRFFDFTIT